MRKIILKTIKLPGQYAKHMAGYIVLALICASIFAAGYYQNTKHIYLKGWADSYKHYSSLTECPGKNDTQAKFTLL